MTATFDNENDRLSFLIDLMVAIKQTPKATRKRFSHKDWWEREEAEKEIIELLLAKINGYSIKSEPSGLPDFLKYTIPPLDEG